MDFWTEINNEVKTILNRNILVFDYGYNIRLEWNLRNNTIIFIESLDLLITKIKIWVYF